MPRYLKWLPLLEAMLRLRTAGVKKGVWGRDESRGAHRHGSSRPSWKELGERSSATRSPLAPSADTRDPLHAGHLENLLRLARLGAIIPPVPAFYIRPKSIDDLVDHAIGRILDLLDIDTDLPHRWREADN